MSRSLLSILLVFLISSNVYAKKPKSVPAFSAKSYIVADANGNILKEQDGNIVLPIASISKLIIALIVSEQDMNEDLEIPNNRHMRSSIPGSTKTLTRKELLTLSLVKSDNFATQVLCSHVPHCVDRMNEKVKQLGMMDTHFGDPTGLDDSNVSTARDLLKLLMFAAENHTITSVTSMPYAEIPTAGKHSIKVNNTNPLVSKLNITLSKTGTTKAAGSCLVMILHSIVGDRILILLGSKKGRRVPDMERLIRDL